jgi:hypothetical protein
MLGFLHHGVGAKAEIAPETAESGKLSSVLGEKLVKIAAGSIQESDDPKKVSKLALIGMARPFAADAARFQVFY